MKKVFARWWVSESSYLGVLKVGLLASKQMETLKRLFKCLTSKAKAVVSGLQVVHKPVASFIV